MTVSRTSLEKSALWRLRRASLTERQLRDGLRKKLRRAPPPPLPGFALRANGRGGQCHKEPWWHANDDDALAWVDEVVAKMKRLGFVDDERTAAARVRSLRASGTSSRGVLAKLRQKGVAADVAQRALADADDAGGDAELDAARAYARRRRLHTKERDKALASLARRGFAFSVARRVLDELTRGTVVPR